MDDHVREIAAQDIEGERLDENDRRVKIGEAVLEALRHLPSRMGDDYARTILGRAQNGRDMAALAYTGTSYLAYEWYEEGLVDALANLMHFARRYEIDFDEKLDSARRHHAAESRLGWDEVPR